MNTKNYNKFRSLGQGALEAWRNAVTLEAFDELRYKDCTMIEAQMEMEPYSDIYGQPDTKTEEKKIMEMIDRDRCWLVQTKFLNPRGQWEYADSIGMIIESKPCDPFCNPYVIDLMRSCVDQYEAAWADAGLAV